LTGDGLWFHELAERYGMLDGLYCSHWQWTIGFWTPTIFKPTDDDRKILDIAAIFRRGADGAIDGSAQKEAR
jgi:hypothetical protein